jgi:peptide deformylase
MKFTMKDLVLADAEKALPKTQNVSLPLSEEDLGLLRALSAFVLESQTKKLDENGDKFTQAIGVAATQFGISKRMFVITTVDSAGVLFTMAVVNPVIENHSKTQIFIPEGESCLSIPERKGIVPRYENIRWSGILVDLETGETEIKKLSKVSGYLGIVFQHEYDHLQGILYTDKMTTEMPYEETDLQGESMVSEAREEQKEE